MLTVTPPTANPRRGIAGGSARVIVAGGAVAGVAVAGVMLAGVMLVGVMVAGVMLAAFLSWR
jgi:hypothetical protein